MSIEPPKTGKGTSGPIILLVFVSILLLVGVLIFGMLAFVIDQPEDNGGDAPDPATALTASNFTIISSATGRDTATMQVDVVVTNTSDQAVENAQVIIQCEDGGYVSAIKAVPRLESQAKAIVELQLSGTGNPACSDPDIAFSASREGN